ncbi:3-hydroxyacyl-CoA dehydrogenase family protein [Laceyella putida]|uniref:3-hydroxyacyl-CoA dehydrogenase family protein n=1 Tax=Laceyella putida TaxID=110101 RepID=A0ABW2RHY6_9BACL
MKDKVVILGTGTAREQLVSFLASRRVATIPLEQMALYEVLAVFDLETGCDDRKRVWLTRVEQVIPSQVPIFTSVLHRTATEIASWLAHPARVVGFSPLQFADMPVLEVSRPMQAEGDAGWPAHLQVLTRWGKAVEEVGDEPGLVFPRTLALLVNEAAFALAEGIAAKEDIDLAMRKGTNWPFGPLEWADHVGIDQIVAILTGLHRELGEERYRPAPLLRKMIYAGYVGRASGRGFYRYEDKLAQKGEEG